MFTKEKAEEIVDLIEVIAVSYALNRTHTTYYENRRKELIALLSTEEDNDHG